DVGVEDDRRRGGTGREVEALLLGGHEDALDFVSDSDFDRQAVRVARLLLGEVDDDVAALISPGSLNCRRSSAIQPLLEEPREVLAGGLFHRSAEVGGGRIAVAISSIILSSSAPEG